VVKDQLFRIALSTLFCLTSLAAVQQSERYDSEGVGPEGPIGFENFAVCRPGAQVGIEPCSIVYGDGQNYGLTGFEIQSAIDTACDGTRSGTVVIPAGTISLGTTELRVPNNCDVAGRGQSATRLLSSPRSTTVFFSLPTNAMNIRIHDLTMDGGSGTSANESCIVAAGASAPTNITVERITCQNVGGHGVYIAGTVASPGERIKVLGSKIINAGLATGRAGQLYGIVLSFNSHVSAIDNEIGGGGITCGICSFSSINASAPNPITDIQFVGNRIHDLPFNSTPGAAIDLGRARQVVAANNVIWNMAQGGCVTFEAIWGGAIRENSCGVADTVLTGGPIVVKTPDSTQSREAASQDITIVGNEIIDDSAAATTNGAITINGAERNITIISNAIHYLKQPANHPASIYLQLGTNDSNISASGQNFCSSVTVEGNTIVGRAGSSSSTTSGIQLQQNSNCTVDEIVIASNAINGLLRGIYVVAGGNNGVTHAYIHDNALEGNRTGIASDGKTYSTIFSWNNSYPKHERHPEQRPARCSCSQVDGVRGARARGTREPRDDRGRPSRRQSRKSNDCCHPNQKAVT
jgi:hypothetical protein